MIQEFDISITDVGNGKYLVRTEDVAPGVPIAQEQVQWPISEWLQQAKTLMHDPLLGLLKGQPNQRLGQGLGYRSGQVSADAASREPVPSLLSLGQNLYNQLFCGLLRDSWLTAQGVAQNRRQLLRLRLGLKDPQLQQLPWEILHAGDRPLAAGTDITFSRYYADLRQGRDRKPTTPIKGTESLRILMVIAAPSDQDRLELKREVHHLQAELQPTSFRSGDPDNFKSQLSSDLILPEESSSQRLDIQLTILEQPGRSELAQVLEQGKFQMLHYAGHSNLGNAGGDLYLVSRQTGLTERLSGEDLAGLLVNNGVKLAVFNSCRGAYSAAGDWETGWQEQNLAQALINRGIPSVIAMAERIPDDVAIDFTRLLYRNLKQGHPIDLSLNRTRQGLISSFTSEQFYWALPILYMQPNFDGYLASDTPARNTLDGLLFAPFHPELASSTQVTALPSLPLETPPAVNEQAEDADLKTPATLPESIAPPISRLPTTTALLNPDLDSDLNPEINPESTTVPRIDEADLDDLVETLEYEDLLNFNDDATVMADLVEQLSQPPLEDVPLMAADGSESLLPETLETPGLNVGLNIYDQFPEDSSTPSAQAVVASMSDSRPGVVPPDGSGPTSLTPTSNLPAQRSQGWRRYGKQGAFWGGAAVLIAAMVSVSLYDPFQWFTATSQIDFPEAEGPTRIEQLDPLAQGELALNRKDLDQAAKMLGILIAQDQQRQALDLLTANDPTYLIEPEIAFLRGRAQWELFKQGHQDFGATDVRKSWQPAVDAKPNWVDAQIALGFAYYAEGNLPLAIDAWNQAVRVNNQQAFKATTTEAALSPAGTTPTVLNAYAGLAMAAYQLSQIDTDAAEKARLLKQATSYYFKVLSEGENSFQAQQLGNNWLWVEGAIADWQATQDGLGKYLDTQEGL